MGAVNLGTARIIIIVALIAAGVVVLVDGFDEPGTAVAGPSGSPTATVTTEPTGSGSPTATGSASTEPTQTPSPQQPRDVTVAVFNGTTTDLLAAQVLDTLTADGYQNVDPPDNAPAQGVGQTTVYFRTGQDDAQNKADATFLADTYFTDAKVAKLGSDFLDLVSTETTLVVVIGQDYADSVAA
jgi:hypothetical protein